MVGISCAVCRTVQQTHYTIINGMGLCNRCADSYQGQSRMALGILQKMIKPEEKDYGPIDWNYFFENKGQFSKENMKEIKSGIQNRVKENKDREKDKQDKAREKQDYVDKPVRRRDIASTQKKNESVTIQVEETNPATYTNVERTVTKNE